VYCVALGRSVFWIVWNWSGAWYFGMGGDGEIGLVRRRRSLSWMRRPMRRSARRPFWRDLDLDMLM
jgi:hypothetical protein